MAKHIETKLHQLMFANGVALLTALRCSVMTPPNGDGAVMSPKATIYHFSLEGKLHLFVFLFFCFFWSQPLFPTACCSGYFMFEVDGALQVTGGLCAKTKKKEMKIHRSRHWTVWTVSHYSRLALRFPWWFVELHKRQNKQRDVLAVGVITTPLGGKYNILPSNFFESRAPVCVPVGVW